MARAHRHLVTKALSEFAHERLLAPVPDGDGGADRRPRRRRLPVPRPPAAARALGDRPGRRSRARSTASRPRRRAGAVLELQPCCIPDALLATYLEELAARWRRAAFKLDPRTGPTAADLVARRLPADRGGDDRGAPGFVANNGRIGFGRRRARRVRARGRRADPPAVARGAPASAATSRSAPAGPRRTLYLDELGADALAGFEAALRDRGLDPADYLYLPVHPWQWEHRLAVTFAPDVARATSCRWAGAGRVPGAAVDPDVVQPDHPDRHYVKVALAIQNMGFLRGLSPAYMRATPAINDWVADAGRERRRRCAAAASRCCASARRSATPATSTTGSPATRPAPQDARRAVAREPRAAARPTASGWRRWPPCCTATPTARRSSPRWSRASGARAATTGCAPTCAPTCARWCTACSRTSWRSCRTARTSSWCCATTCRSGCS